MMTETMKEIIKIANDAGLTQRELAKKIDKTDGAVSRWYETIEWIPIKTRKLTDEEFEELSEKYDVYLEYAYDCALPDDEEEVLVTTWLNEVEKTTFFRDSYYNCYFEYYEDEGDIIAWAKLPSPYKKG